MQASSQQGEYVKETFREKIENILSCSFVKTSGTLLNSIESICPDVRYMKYG